MTATTILLIILSVIVAGGLSFFQYFFKAGSRLRVSVLLASLRFFSILALLLLLINPVITRNSYVVEKTVLALVVDNSSSVSELKAAEAATESFSRILNNTSLRDKFDIQSYQVDEEFSATETPDFKGRQSRLDLVGRNLKSLHKNKVYPTVLITDGNQTSGSDYIYAFNQANKVYPLILGDTTTFLDLRIASLNVNKYAFHKNKFPVEVFLQYSGTKSVSGEFTIYQGSRALAKQQVSFSPSRKSAVVEMLLPAEKTGLQVYRAVISSAQQEKNTYNNTKNFAVEIIDQKTEVAIVSAITHPDIGALKRSIETNAQRKVTILKPADVKSLDNYNILMLYQPTAAFKNIFESNRGAGINTFIITGASTDFSFLNQHQSGISFRMSNQGEDYLADYNSQFNLFALDNIGFENMPPLQHPFGTLVQAGNTTTLLSGRIRNIPSNSPVLAFQEDRGRRTVFLLGENIWKWRIQSYRDNESFEKFDIFLDKTIQYLVSDNKRKSLVVNHERFYNSGEPVEISAQFFNKNYEFDERARLTIAIENRATGQRTNYDLLRGRNSFKANLDGLPAGNYDFTVKELNSNTSYSANFQIMDFDIEKQFVNPDTSKMLQLAEYTQSQAFLPADTDKLIKTLLDDERYIPIEKKIIKKTPLIEWFWLLVIIALSLASEWLIRKYNGML